jgi:hypothetical protein
MPKCSVQSLCRLLGWRSRPCLAAVWRLSVRVVNGPMGGCAPGLTPPIAMSGPWPQDCPGPGSLGRPRTVWPTSPAIRRQDVPLTSPGTPGAVFNPSSNRKLQHVVAFLVLVPVSGLPRTFLRGVRKLLRDRTPVRTGMHSLISAHRARCSYGCEAGARHDRSSQVGSQRGPCRHGIDRNRPPTPPSPLVDPAAKTPRTADCTGAFRATRRNRACRPPRPQMRAC